ncbi:MAG TPA: hypothetical protein VFU21_05850 [Kofleriaceae bacterium]|nr:hypothetical protein [Kofleriaceae bacterium]
MRAAWLLLVSAGACASGSGAGAPDAGPGGAACATHADCDDRDSCTTDVCLAGRCAVSAIDRCADTVAVVADDFESKADLLVDDSNLDGWSEMSSGDCPVGLEVKLDDRFDYGKPGAFVNGVGGWKFSSAGGGRVELVAPPDDPGGFAMNVVGTTAAGSYGQVSHQVTAQAEGWVELRFWPPGNFKQKWLTLDEKTTTRFYLYFETDGQVKYSNGGSKVSLQSYGEDRWYRIRMAWNASSDRVTVEIDDRVYADLPMHEPIEHRISRLRMRTASASGLSFMIDDVVASGGEPVKGGLASLRVGSPEGICETAAVASRSFDAVRAGTIDVDLLAVETGGPYLVELFEEGSPRAGIELAADGSIRWRRGDSATALPGSWRPGEWLHIELRWDGAFDAWVGDDGAVSGAGLEPSQPIIRGLDELRVTAPAGGALWLDELRIAGAR